tara:strand:+ start:318 stop:536 length:219 start_codon:yes stop_codon:yes gene_type:complete
MSRWGWPRREERSEEYAQVEAELLDETDWAYKLGYGTNEAWVAKSKCKDVEINGKTLRCLMEEWLAIQEELV